MSIGWTKLVKIGVDNDLDLRIGAVVVRRLGGREGCLQPLVPDKRTAPASGLYAKLPSTLASAFSWVELSAATQLMACGLFHVICRVAAECCSETIYEIGSSESWSVLKCCGRKAGTSAGCWLYGRRHRAFAARDQRVGTEGLDLIPLQLRLLQVGGRHNHPPCSVDLPRHLITFLHRMPEDPLQHQDHILIAVIVVIEQDYVVGRQPLCLVLFLLYWPGNRICHSPCS